MNRHAIWRMVGRAAVSLAVAVAVCCSTAGRATAEGPAGEVYYQVTYADGTVRDLGEPPTTNQGIRGVLRISRFEGRHEGYEVLTTEGPALRLAGRGRTEKQELTWNGRAWAAPAGAGPGWSPAVEEAPSGPSLLPTPDVLGDEIRRTEAVVAALRGRLKELDHLAAEAERNLAKVKGGPQEADAAAALATARGRRDIVVRAAEQYAMQLQALRDTADKPTPLHPSGKIDVLPGPTAGKAFGVRTPTTRRAVLPHQVQVWKLPVAQGRRTYSVEAAHAEAGELGAFRYVVYADGDGDGVPDKPLACSPLATAATPGEWTRWSFATSEPRVYVGHAWPHPGASVYCQRLAEEGAARSDLDASPFVAPLGGVCPRRQWQWWPYLTNLRVFVNQNPDAYAPPPHPEVVEE